MRKIITIIIFLALIISPLQTMAGIVSVEAISVSSAEVLGSGLSFSAGLTEDGRYVLITSESSNLVSGDTNGVTDVFLRDRTLGTTVRVSVGDGEEEANAESTLGNVTSDGRYVVFTSDATNLVSGDTNLQTDLFLRDTVSGSTVRLNVNSDDEEADASAYSPFITPDGEFAIFATEATNLVPGDTNAQSDVFIVTLATGDIERVSVSSSEVEGDDYSGAVGFAYMSADARYVVFDSNATNLVAGDTNAALDIFVRDRTLGTTERLSVSSSEVQGNGDSSYPYISSDGQFVSFISDATNLVTGDVNGVTDVFVRDLVSGTTQRVSTDSSATESNGASSFPYVSDSGRFVVFSSDATNLVTGDTNAGADSFIHDTLSGTTERISLTEGGVEATGSNSGLALGILTGNGQYVVLSAGFDDIISGDSNSTYDVFLYELTDGDGVTASVERDAPNSGDVDENGFIDSVEQNVSSFVNAVSTNYASVVTTGDCVRNDSPSAVAESSLGAQDSGYDYPLGIISFEIECQNAGETATVSLYCFCENTPLAGLVARKYNQDTDTYTTIDSAVISEVTIDGDRALKMVYDVVDGGSLDEDGLSNGTIVDPVGFAVAVAEESSGGGSSSGSRTRRSLAVSNNESAPTNFCRAFSTSMKIGSKFGEVAELQKTLNAKGFDSGLADGWFGKLTHAAVQKFQTANGLVSDGIVGPITRNALNKCN